MLAAQPFEHSLGKRRIVKAGLRRVTRLLGVVQENKFLRILDRHIAQQDSVHHAEYRGVGADTERQSQHCDQNKARRTAKLADPVADILHDRGSRHGSTSAGF